jgi:hypothetical protein
MDHHGSGVFRPYPCHYWTVVAHCRAEFLDLILATTGPWWPIARQSFSTLSLLLLGGGGPLQGRVFRSYPILASFLLLIRFVLTKAMKPFLILFFISVLPPHVNIITIHGWEISFLIRSLHVELYLNNLRKRYPGCKCSFTLSQHYVN